MSPIVVGNDVQFPTVRIVQNVLLCLELDKFNNPISSYSHAVRISDLIEAGIMELPMKIYSTSRSIKITDITECFDPEAFVSCSERDRKHK